MNSTIKLKIDWIAKVHEIGKDFAKRADQSDQEGSFVFHNYEQLKAYQFFSALVPEELGGGGVHYSEMCEIIKNIAHYCGSTALAFAMHQHLVAAAVWKYKNQGLSAEMLKKVAMHQLVLISTGARDWLGSNGELKKTDGGFLFSAKKHFASQSEMGDIAITSAPYCNEKGEYQVLHFPVPMEGKGIQVLEDWDTLGMRSTGSNTIVFNEVFVPEGSIALARPQGEFHKAWDVVLTVAMPLIMSAYVGIAERAMEIAVEIGKKYKRGENEMPYLIGKLNNSLISAKTQWQAMHWATNNFNFQPSQQITLKILSLKSNVADATREVVAEAMEAIGGQSFYRKNELERLFRDVQASQFHPLPKWEQYKFCGERILEKVS